MISTAAIGRVIRIFKDLSSLTLRIYWCKVSSTVHLEAPFSLFATKGPLFAEAYCGYSISRHALTHQELFNGDGPTVTKTYIVFFAAALVTVSFDRKPDIRVGF